MGVFAYIKNGVKYKMNQFPGAYPANRVSYNGSDVKTALDELNADIDKSYKEVWSGSDTTFPATTTNFINGNLTGYTYAGVLVDNVLHIIKMGVRTRITDTFYLNGAVYVATRVFTINETNFVTEAGETNGTVTANRIVPKAIVGIH